MESQESTTSQPTTTPTTEAAPLAEQAPQLSKFQEAIQKDMQLAAQRDAGEEGQAELATQDQKQQQEKRPDADDLYLERIAKKNIQLRKKEQALSQREKEIQGDLELANKHRELTKLAKENPLAAQRQLEIDTNILIQKMIEEGEEKRPLTLEERMDRYEKAERMKEEQFRLQQERENESRQEQALKYHQTNYLGTVVELVNQDEERYELIKTFGQQDRVWNRAIKHFNATNQLLTPDVIMNELEAELRDDIKLFLSTKLYKRLQQDQSQSSKRTAIGTPITKPASLTNSKARSAAPISKDENEESEEERSRRALAIFLSRQDS